jgi:hypothetical protein
MSNILSGHENLPQGINTNKIETMSSNADQPAFPKIQTEGIKEGSDYSSTAYGNVYSTGGLTKREYFAGLAMQIYCTHPSYYTTDKKHLAKAAIEIADELLNQLNQSK